MALQVADIQYDHQFNLSLAQSKDLLFQWGINDALKKNWKGMYDLVQYNGLGAARLMLASGALTAAEKQDDFTIESPDGGTKGAHEAWTEYGKLVLQYLRKINPAPQLKKVREELRDEIIAQYYKEAPKWPSEIGSKSDIFHYLIEKYGETDPEDNNFRYMYCIWGMIQMQDTKVADNTFKASIWTKPKSKVTIKCVRFDVQKMQMMNQLCISHPEAAKIEADKAARQSLCGGNMKAVCLSQDSYREAERKLEEQAAALRRAEREQQRKTAEAQRKVREKEAAARREIEEFSRKMKEKEEALQRERRESERKLRERKAEQKRAEDARRRAEMEAQRSAEQLRQQQQQQREQLSRSIKTLTAQLQAKEIEYDQVHQRAMSIASKIAMEEKEIESFRVEREDNSTKIVITLGMTGAGKSTLCNRLNGDKSMMGNQKGGCETSGNGESCTQKNAKIVIQVDGQKVTVVDTPGYGDSLGGDRDHCNRLCEYLKGCGGINSFVLVRNGANVRFDMAFQNMLEEYYEMFGQTFFDRLIIVATRIEFIAKMQYEQNNQESALRGDICKHFNLKDLKIPVIPIGFEKYDESIEALVKAVHSDRHEFDDIRSPIDELRADLERVDSEKSALKAEMNSIQSEIDRFNEDMQALPKE